MKILIVEDDLVSRNFLSKILENYGECDQVIDGMETIDDFLMALKDKEPYQLICLDIMMPKVDGVKALREISNHEKALESNTNFREKGKNTAKRSMQKKDLPTRILNETSQMEDGFFLSVCALPDYQLKVTMKTGTTIHFDFRTRLNTARFGMLRDEELFGSVKTDGDYLTFNKVGRMPVKITASEFMDLVLIDRGK